ncbi:hypothetical protein OGAPHI_004999 [Ogataea philodendri]|uniref:Uncharacterized protein n=1 Tax=Ogataea philodendri TaxID=1378263 RepID=A0A9P8P119_9ASCO|nr:uncharacterized protein OGAPHI_004999 [Ogataea philodendri]KAH3663598.1 hypothetical protein OGAPHI_004999 [Ogataea philodendri]
MSPRWMLLDTGSFWNFGFLSFTTMVPKRAPWTRPEEMNACLPHPRLRASWANVQHSPSPTFLPFCASDQPATCSPYTAAPSSRSAFDACGGGTNLVSWSADCAGSPALSQVNLILVVERSLLRNTRTLKFSLEFTGGCQLDLAADLGGGTDGLLRDLGAGEAGEAVPELNADDLDFGGVGGAEWLGLCCCSFKVSKFEVSVLVKDSGTGFGLRAGFGFTTGGVPFRSGRGGGVADFCESDLSRTRGFGGARVLSSCTTECWGEMPGLFGSGGASSSTEETEFPRDGREGSGGASSSSDDNGVLLDTVEERCPSGREGVVEGVRSSLMEACDLFLLIWTGGGGNLDATAENEVRTGSVGLGAGLCSVLGESCGSVFFRLFLQDATTFSSSAGSGAVTTVRSGFLALIGGGIFGLGFNAGFSDDMAVIRRVRPHSYFPNITMSVEELAAKIVKEQLAVPLGHENKEFQVLSTVRYDPLLYSGKLPLGEALTHTPLDKSLFFLFKYHVERLNRSIDYFKIPSPKVTEAGLLSRLSEALQDKPKNQTYKLRVLIDKTGNTEVQAIPISVPLNLSLDAPVTWTVYMDSEPTMISPFTSFKSTNRPHYDAARKRKIPEGSQNVEVVLFNHADQITETSICNIAFLQPAKNPLTNEVTTKWTTPVLSSGCLRGVTRAYLLETEQIVEGHIPKSSVKNGDQPKIYSASASESVLSLQSASSWTLGLAFHANPRPAAPIINRSFAPSPTATELARLTPCLAASSSSTAFFLLPSTISPAGSPLSTSVPSTTWVLSWLANASPPLQDNTDLLSAMIAGSGAAVVQTVLTYPFEYLKTTTQITNKALTSIKYDIPTHNLRSLFVGCGGLAGGNALKASSRFLIFNQLSETMGTYGGKTTAPQVVVAGLMTGFLETLVVIPFENIKTRMIENSMETHGYKLPIPNYYPSAQADKTEKHRLTKRPGESKLVNPRQKYIEYYRANPSTTFLRAVKEIYETAGLSGFKRGSLITIFRQVMNSMVWFSTYNFLQQFIDPTRDSITDLELMGMGVASSCAVVAITQPIDVVKTRMQTKNYKPIYRDIMTLIVKTFMQEGARKLWSGWMPRLVKVSCSSSVTLMTGAKRGAVKKFTNKVNGTDIEISSWKFNEWDYSSNKVQLPIYARGLFTTADRIVCRGYDKFYNVDELGWVSRKALRETITGPCTLTVKANGCIVFVSGLADGTLVVCSKHSTGARSDLSRNHALAAQEALERQLRAAGHEPTELAMLLYRLKLTAVAEYCDDSFEEHILEYSNERAGLYLHGLNFNTCKFRTCSMEQVAQLAEKFGFKTIESIELSSITETFEFLDKVAETGIYNGEEIEGFVVRCKRDGDDFFFKYKFDEPYLLYRQLREVTKQYLTKGLENVSFRNHKLICMDYLRFVIPLFEESPELKEDYLRDRGIIKLRKMYINHKQKTGKQIIEEEASLEKLDEDLKAAEYGAEPCKYVLVTVATIGCGKTTTSLTLSNMYPDLIGVVQSDDIPSPIKDKQVAKCLEVLVEKPIVILDRNNHKFIERQQTFEYFANLNKLIPSSKLKFVCLNFLGGINKSDPKLWKITSSRVMERGNNHQSIKVEDNGTYKVEMIMKGFLGRFQPVDVSQSPDSHFDYVIDLKVSQESSLDNAVHIANKLREIASDLSIPPPSPEKARIAFEQARVYKPTVNKIVRTKKEKPQYFGIEVSSLDGLPALEHIPFYQQLKANGRVQNGFHVTLIHIATTKKNEPVKKIYQNYCNLIKNVDKTSEKMLLSYKADIKLLRVCWNSQVMCIEVEVTGISLNGENIIDELGVGNKHPHITVGTISASVGAKESNSILEELYEFGPENIKVEELGVELHDLPLFVRY